MGQFSMEIMRPSGSILGANQHLGLIPSDSMTQSGNTDSLLTAPVFSLVLVPSENPFWGTTVALLHKSSEGFIS